MPLRRRLSVLQGTQLRTPNSALSFSTCSLALRLRERKVVHRDVKPENVLYDHRTDRLLIADFGVADFKEEDLFTAVESKDQRLRTFCTQRRKSAVVASPRFTMSA